jgi:hypothetical protein
VNHAAYLRRTPHACRCWLVLLHRHQTPREPHNVHHGANVTTFFFLSATRQAPSTPAPKHRASCMPTPHTKLHNASDTRRRYRRARTRTGRQLLVPARIATRSLAVEPHAITACTLANCGRRTPFGDKHHLLRLRRHTPLAMGAAPHATTPSSPSATHIEVLLHRRRTPISVPDRIDTRSTVVTPPLVITLGPPHSPATSPHRHHSTPSRRRPQPARLRWRERIPR